MMADACFTGFFRSMIMNSFCLAPLILSLVPAQDPGAALIEQVRGIVKDANKPFTLLIRIEAKEDAGAKLEAAFAKAIKSTRQEKGSLVYDLDRDPQKPGHYVIYEKWKDLPSLEAHLKADYITSLLAQLHELTSGAPDLQILVPAGE
jgi:quinol monooxygenase YgiN